MSSKDNVDGIISVDIKRIPVNFLAKDGPIKNLYRCKVTGRINGKLVSLNRISRQKNGDVKDVKKYLRLYLKRGGTLTENKTDSQSSN